MTAPKLAYSIQSAAAAYDVSEDVLRKALKATEPPFLRGKKIGGKWSIPAAELEAWHDSLPDA